MPFEWEQELPFESTWIEIKSKSSFNKLFVNAVYIPPNTKFEHYEKYLDSITEIMCAREPNAKFIVVGDFNMGASIDWISYFASSQDNGKIANELINTIAINDLRQINHVRNTNGRILDLALTNINVISLFAATELSKVDTHHPAFDLQFTCNDLKYIVPKKTTKKNYFKANYGLINNRLDSIDWNALLEVSDINRQIDIFYKHLTVIIDKYTHIIQPRDDKYPKWFTKKLITFINDKNYFHDKFKKTDLAYYELIYKKKT